MARKEHEIWENRNHSEIWVNVTDAVSGDIKPVRVAPGRRLEITPEDRRRLNQEAAIAGVEFDWFSNGALSQVHLVDTAEDYEEVASNINSKSESEIRDLLKLDANKLKKELAEISSPLVMERLKAYIDSDDADKADGLTVAKVKAVNARYEQLNPQKTGVKIFDTYEEAIAKPITLN